MAALAPISSSCPLCALDPATVAAAIAGVSQRAAALALGVPKTTMLRHLAEHTAGPSTVREGATVQATVQASAPTVQAGPVVFAASPVPVQASAPVAAPVSPVAAPVQVQAPTVASTVQGPAGGQPCATCVSPFRGEIEEALARGRGYKPIEALYRKQGGPSNDSIRHHALCCCPDALAKAADLRASAVAATAAKAAEWMETLLHRAEAILDRAEAAGTIGETTGAFRELRATVSDLAKITGEVSSGVEVKVVQSKDYSTFKSLVASTLCPGCLAALGAALTAAEAS